MSVNAALPKTPSKANDGIENIKRTLSADWGIQLSARGSGWSPAKRDHSRVEDKIDVRIQFLYFQKPPQDGALDYALNEFEKNAVLVISKWQFKPHGEADVVPSLGPSKSALKQDFLKKRPALSENAITELTKSLSHFLDLTFYRVKAGEEFPKSVKSEDEKSHFCFQLRLPETISDKPVPTNKVSPIKPSPSKRQSNLGQWLRSKSEQGPAKSGELPAQHPSSDDYPDLEMAELLVDADAMKTSLAVPTKWTNAPKASVLENTEQTSSSEDAFETPPTTPPPEKSSSLSHSTDKKRSRPDSMQAPPSRNVSRKISTEKSAQEVSGLIAS